jgi:hypothetical protein
MTELTEAPYDAYAVIGPEIPRLEHELGGHFRLCRANPDHRRATYPYARLPRYCGPGCHRGEQPVCEQRHSSCLSNGDRFRAVSTTIREAFLAQVGVPPKLYARIIRFNAALDHKLRRPVHGAASPTITTSMIRCIWCMTVLLSRESPFTVPGTPRGRARIPYILRG